MAKPKEPDAKPVPCSIHVQMERLLLMAMDTVRMKIQADSSDLAVVSRADVVRLALRRLHLAYLAHLSEQPSPPPDLMQQWDATVAAMRAEGPVPDWLVPGPSLCLLHGRQNAKAREGKNPKKGE